jgi:hypothetical protein
MTDLTNSLKTEISSLRRFRSSSESKEKVQRERKSEMAVSDEVEEGSVGFDVKVEVD